MVPGKWPLWPAATAPPHCCRLPRHPSCDKGCAWRAACFSRRKGGLRAPVSCPAHGGFSSGHWCIRPGATRGTCCDRIPAWTAHARRPCRRASVQAGRRHRRTGGRVRERRRKAGGLAGRVRHLCPPVCRFQIFPSCRGVVARGAGWSAVGTLRHRPRHRRQKRTAAGVPAGCARGRSAAKVYFMR